MKKELKQTIEPTTIREGVQRIKRQKRIAILLFLCFLPVAVLSFFLDDYYHINFLFVILPYLAFVMAWDFYAGLTAICPRCGERYYWRVEGIGFRNFLTKRCLNCGLELDLKK
jgi:hypothetical protein